MTTYASMLPVLKSLLGDQTGEVYSESDMLLALQAAYKNLLFLGYSKQYTTTADGVTPDLAAGDEILFCVAAACLLLGGKLADPSLAMRVRSEESEYDGRGGAESLQKRLNDLQSGLRKAILEGTSAAIGHLTDMGLALPSDSPVKGFWPDE